MASNQLQAKFKEAARRVISRKLLNREEISINIEEEMGLIEDQQLETEFEERNSGSGVSRDFSTEEIQPTKEQQGENSSMTSVSIVSKSGESGQRDNNNSSTTTKPLVNLIKRNLHRVHPSISSEYSIYRVPRKIRKLKEEAYHPRVISIGPFHHGDKRFSSMETFKMRYLKKMDKRSTGGGVGLEKYVEFLKGQEASVRKCYSETIDMGSDEFLTMLLLDGFFIIELLLCEHDMEFIDVDYCILKEVRLQMDIYHDLILLENQIPFFLLEGLFNLARKNIGPIPDLLDLTVPYFDEYNAQKKSPKDINSIKHFTDLILIIYRPMSPRIAATECQITKTATKLIKAGVTFKMGSGNCLLDIKFTSHDGVLEIPRIKLNDNMESILRNLMALELCHYPDDTYMIDYLKFMDYLVNKPRDVSLLVECGVIENWLGDYKQAADLFNNMNINFTFSRNNSYFSRLSKELNTYSKIPRHEWRAALIRDYFSSPWRSASTSAAIVLLVLTFIQTVCSLVSIGKGK